MVSGKQSHGHALQAIANHIAEEDMAAKPTPAAAKVFGETDLVEQILHHLPKKDLLLAQRVCKKFNDIIKRSKNIQKALGFKATGTTVVNGGSTHDGNDRAPGAPHLFKCTLCNKKYRRRNNLRRHFRLHTGVKPFACSYPGCNERFHIKYSFTHHTKQHDWRHFLWSGKRSPSPQEDTHASQSEESSSEESDAASESSADRGYNDMFLPTATPKARRLQELSKKAGEEVLVELGVLQDELKIMLQTLADERKRDDEEGIEREEEDIVYETLLEREAEFLRNEYLKALYCFQAKKADSSYVAAGRHWG